MQSQSRLLEYALSSAAFLAGITGATSEVLDVSLVGGTLLIDLPENLTNYTVEIFNAAGQLVHSNDGLGERQLGLPNLASGIYLLQLSAGNKKYNAKFIVP